MLRQRLCLRMHKFLCSLYILSMLCSPAFAGVNIGGTRFVFPSDKQSIEVTLNNPDDQSYLVHTKVLPADIWSGNETKLSSTPFIVVPPLFVLGSGKENKVRILSNDVSLPKDRESVFDLSLSFIPSGKAIPGSVKMAMRSHFKLFWRPATLKGNAQEAYSLLKWRKKGNVLQVENPSPWYVTVVNLKVGGHKVIDAQMIPPFSSVNTPAVPAGSAQISWQAFGDYGELMPVKHSEVTH